MQFYSYFFILLVYSTLAKNIVYFRFGKKVIVLGGKLHHFYSTIITLMNLALHGVSCPPPTNVRVKSWKYACYGWSLPRLQTRPVIINFMLSCFPVNATIIVTRPTHISLLTDLSWSRALLNLEVLLYQLSSLLLRRPSTAVGALPATPAAATWSSCRRLAGRSFSLDSSTWTAPCVKENRSFLKIDFKFATNDDLNKCLIYISKYRFHSSHAGSYFDILKM